LPPASSHDPAGRPLASTELGWPGQHGATVSGPAPSPADVPSHGHGEQGRSLLIGLIGVLLAIIPSLIFIVSFVGALHNPGPRSVPVGVVAPPAVASRLGAAVDHAVPGGFVVTSYPTTAAAINAINTRTIDAALVPGPRVQHLLVARAVSASLTNVILKGAAAAAHRAGVPLAVTDIRPLHPGDPDGLSQTFFVVALLAPSLLFGTQLVSRVVPRLSSLWQLALIVIYAPIVATVAVAVVDPGIVALTGAAWGLFGIGTLLAFAAAVMGAAAARWAGGIGVALLGLLFIPVGIASSGVTLGPNMITPWYADLGRALPPGSALPAVLNTTYFHAAAITTPLLVLSAWALAGIIAMVLAAILHPPIPGQRAELQPATEAGARMPTARHRATAR
jgi:hypothetical protein